MLECFPPIDHTARVGKGPQMNSQSGSLQGPYLQSTLVTHGTSLTWIGSSYKVLENVLDHRLGQRKVEKGLILEMIRKSFPCSSESIRGAHHHSALCGLKIVCWQPQKEEEINEKGRQSRD